MNTEQIELTGSTPVSCDEHTDNEGSYEYSADDESTDDESTDDESTDDEYVTTDKSAVDEEPDYDYLMAEDENGTLLHPEGNIPLNLPWELILHILHKLDSTSVEMMRRSCKTIYEFIVPTEDPEYMLVKAAVSGYTGVFEILVDYTPNELCEYDTDFQCHIRDVAGFTSIHHCDNMTIADIVVINASTDVVHEWAVRGWLSKTAALIAAECDRFDNVRTILGCTVQRYEPLFRFALRTRNADLMRSVCPHFDVKAEYSLQGRYTRNYTNKCIITDNAEFLRHLIAYGVRATWPDITLAFSRGNHAILDVLHDHMTQNYGIKEIRSIIVDAAKIAVDPTQGLNWLLIRGIRITPLLFGINRLVVIDWLIDNGIVPRKGIYIRHLLANASTAVLMRLQKAGYGPQY